MEINIQQVSKYYSDVLALDNVSLDIADGELFFLLGPSGCGKTTLLRCLGGFEQPSQGKILFEGKDVSNVPANQRNSAMVFQGYALWPHLTVWENISFGLEMQKIAKEERVRRITDVLAKVQITDLAKRKPNELSGGQQQRVALARTLVVAPGCLLLDEPLANLDAKLRRDMRLEIRRLCKNSGLTGIYVTHDRQEALSMADRIAIMQAGKICQVGTATEIYRQPQSRFVASFIGESNLLSGKCQTISTGEAVVETACGVFRAGKFPAGLQPGSSVWLSIRPEALHAAGPAPVNRVQVTLQHIDYLGEMADNISVTADGTAIKFFELNPRSTRPEGSSITLEADPDEVVVMLD
ncbi:MAG: ABC transporter ATP-binding protein [Oligosphaeraceae bacterium]|nr:ABC transporter ATP-binding protein [Oligosphaeraceae bacterium]